MIMKNIYFSITISFIFFSNDVEPQTGLDSFIGTWKGTSLCQVKNSPCHDEVVVYYITKTNTDSCNINGNKIVNGAEDYMGTLPCKFDKKTNTLMSTAYGLWNFKLEDGKLKGTLINKNSLYRIIELSKIK